VIRGSKPEVGSSSISRSTSGARASIIPIFCLFPLLSSFTFLSSSNPKIAANSSIRRSGI